jgi:hypothetical protein
MPGKFTRVLLPLLALIAGIAAAACGTVATPEWAAEAQATRVAQAATSEHLTAIAPTATPTTPPTETPVPPTATPIPPTATPVPPTETPIPPTATMNMDMNPPTNNNGTGADASGAPADLAAKVAAANAANGQTLFTTQHDTANGTWACAQCHSVTPDEARIIGPGLYNVSVHGGMHVPGEDALHYIYQSIVNPSAYVVPDYPDNLMPKNWHEVLGEQGVEDVIAYLMTLHD